MSSLMLGRALLADTEISWSISGNRVSVRGATTLGRKYSTEIIRQQLLGYVDSADESFVPFMWEDEPSLAGYYRVLEASVGGAGYLAFTGKVSWSVELERVTSFAAPLIELHSLGAQRTGAPSSPYPVIVVPGETRSVAFFDDDTDTWFGATPDTVRDCEAGSVKVYARGETLTQYYVDPDKFYEGAATIMMGEDMAPVVGRQTRNTPDLWRLSSGLYEIEPVAGGQFEWRHRMWLDGDWTPWVSFLWYTSTGPDPRAPMPAPHSVIVLRNSPTEVAIRLQSTIGNARPVTVDLSLRRGARSVSVVLQSTTAGNFAVQSAGLTWNQDEDWYVWDDADGVRHFVAAATDVGILGGGGVIPYEDSVSQVRNWTLTIGAADTDAEVGPDHILKIIDAWMWAGSEQQAVVVQ